MGRDELRRAIFDIIEYFTKFQMSDQSKRLVIHYFNKSKGQTAREKAVKAIEYYLQDDVITDDMPSFLQELVKKLYAEADSWEKE